MSYTFLPWRQTRVTAYALLQAGGHREPSSTLVKLHTHHHPSFHFWPKEGRFSPWSPWMMIDFPLTPSIHTHTHIFAHSLFICNLQLLRWFARVVSHFPRIKKNPKFSVQFLALSRLWHTFSFRVVVLCERERGGGYRVANETASFGRNWIEKLSVIIAIRVSWPFASGGFRWRLPGRLEGGAAKHEACNRTPPPAETHAHKHFPREGAAEPQQQSNKTKHWGGTWFVVSNRIEAID